MTGYRLSAAAARAEQRYNTSRSLALQGKTVIGLGDALSGFYSSSRQDGTNFRTNMVTLAQFSDASAATAIGAMGVATTWACVNLLAGTIASLPLMVYRDVNGANVAAKDHPLYRLLHDRPNFDQTALDFWEFMQGSLELAGNAYAVIERTGGRVTSLRPVVPELMQVRRLANGQIGYTWTEDSRKYEKTERDVFHIRGFGGGPLGGISTLSVCRRVFASAMSVDQAASATFSNGVRPTGVLRTKDTLVGDQRKEAERVLTEKYAGAINAGVPMILDRDMQWQQLTINPEDAQMLESRGFSVEEICRVFGVPPHMVGHTAGNTQLGSSITEQTRGFEKFTLRRRVKRIEQAAMQQLLTPADVAGGISIEFGMEGLLRGSSEERAAFYESGLKNKWKTINEVRALENDPPVPWGDRPWGQQQDIQLQENGTVPPATDAPEITE